MKSARETAGVRYNEGCLAAHALNLVGDRWALLVVRELVFSAKRFQMIRLGLPGVTASVLTARLAQLQAAGLVAYDALASVYSLTGAGRGLQPVLESLCRWALTVPGHDPLRFISPSALMISMGVCAVPQLTAGRRMLAHFDFGSECFEMRVHLGQVTTRATAERGACFAMSGTGNSLASAVYGKSPLKTLMRSGAIAVEGEVASAQNFVDCFTLQSQT